MFVVVTLRPRNKEINFYLFFILLQTETLFSLDKNTSFGLLSNGSMNLLYHLIIEELFRIKK